MSTGRARFAVVRWLERGDSSRPRSDGGGFASPESSIPGGLHDGCSTRREAILACLEKAVDLRLLELRHRGGLLSALRRFGEFLSFLAAEIGPDRIVVFYPDFPFFHPPARFKSFLLRIVLACLAMQRKAARTSLLHLDIVDLPRWQAPSLGYRLRMSGGALRAAEERICRTADVITIPSRAMAELLAEDLGLDTEKFRVLPNGLPVRPGPARGLPSSADETRGTVYLYAGDLSCSSGRAIFRLLDQFRSCAGSGDVLHLCGPGGGWIEGGIASAKKVSQTGSLVRLSPGPRSVAGREPCRQVVAGGGDREDPEIVYHGHIPEYEVLELAERCDFGLLPYPEEGYFHCCHPSKLGLYLAAGLPVLSSKLQVAGETIRRMEAGYTRAFEDFGSFFSEGRSLRLRFDREAFVSRCRAYDWPGRVLEAFGCPRAADGGRR